MRIAYNTQNINPDKPPLMPGEYYFDKREIEDSMITQYESMGYTVVTLEQFNTTMNAIDLTAYNASIAPTPQQTVQKIIENAQDFGESLIKEFSLENVLMGITQAGKTGAVSIYLHRLEHYLEQGSLYEAIKEINLMLSTGLPSELSPFITIERMTIFLNKLKVYMGIPI